MCDRNADADVSSKKVPGISSSTALPPRKLEESLA